jgi:hypothetical protein
MNAKFAGKLSVVHAQLGTNMVKPMRDVGDLRSTAAVGLGREWTAGGTECRQVQIRAAQSDQFPSQF